MAMPLLLEVEVLSRTPDLEARWDEVKKPFYSRGKLGSTTEGKDGDDAARQPSLLPRYLYAGYDEPSDYATPYDDEAYEDEAYEDEDELSEDDVRLDVGEHFGEDEDEDEDDEEEEEESGSEYED